MGTPAVTLLGPLIAHARRTCCFFWPGTRGPLSLQLTGIASQATLLAASPGMSEEHVGDLLRIAGDAGALLSKVRAESAEIDRTMMTMLERAALSPDSTSYIFPPAQNQ